MGFFLRRGIVSGWEYIGEEIFLEKKLLKKIEGVEWCVMLGAVEALGRGLISIKNYHKITAGLIRTRELRSGLVAI